MKKLLLFIIVLFFENINSQTIQINFNSGYNIYVITDSVFTSYGNATNNSDINIILSNYNVNSLIQAYRDDSSVILVENPVGNISNLINELLSNPNVAKVQRCYTPQVQYPTFADELHLTLISNDNGNPIGFNTSNNVETTNPQLNALFETYHVKLMEHFGGQRGYSIRFDGDITGLYDSLRNLLGSVFEFVDLAPVGLILNNPENIKSKVTIYPNPFYERINIETEEPINNYLITDITGKTFVNTTSQSEINNHTSQLSSGIYILEVTFENGQKVNSKLIKK